VKLNSAQHEAVETLAGPLLVLAGAGTGKTRVVTHRIARLIQSGIRPNRILAVTFTNKAADEMLHRASAMLKKRQRDEPEISTFHSLCVRILRRNITQLGYPAQFAIYDRGDQESIARAALREIKVAEGTLRPGELLYRISRWKTVGVSPAEAAATAASDKDHLASAAFRRYQAALKAAGAVDFDDLLLLTDELFGRFPEVHRAEAGRFDHVLVDEYQDTNAVQYRIVKALAGRHRNLCVVGDDDQSIYGWRGAEVRHILRFKRDWPEAKVVRLETNYRSTREILDWANRLIAFNRVRHPKTLRAVAQGEPPRVLQLQTETDEAQRVVDEIAERIRDEKRRPKDFAILCRTNEQPRAFETELRRAEVPYVLLGGMSFFDRKEVRDVLAYLKLLANPRDEVSLLRIINTPPRGLGPTVVRRLLDAAVGQGKTLSELLPRAEQHVALTPTARTGIDRLRSLLGEFARRAKKEAPARLARELIAEVGYYDEMARQYPNPDEQQARWASVEEVVNAVGAYERRAKKPSLAGFLRDVALSGTDEDRQKESKLKRDAVVLMTLHAAKGLEFPEVYMVGMEEGLLPHHRAAAEGGTGVDEERRLCYVGVTRAQRRLTLSLALTRLKWGKPRPTHPSRFLYELAGQADNPNYAIAMRGGKTGHSPSSSGGRSR
jgi:DNA helicase-2/ATP-dependent DNA helicase PcrA